MRSPVIGCLPTRRAHLSVEFVEFVELTSIDTRREKIAWKGPGWNEPASAAKRGTRLDQEEEEGLDSSSERQGARIVL